MTTTAIANILMYLEPLACLAAILFIGYRKQLREYRYLALYLLTRVVSFVVCSTVIHFANRGIEMHLAYKIYFYIYWATNSLEALLAFLLIYSIYNLAAPLKGIQRLGRIMFRWAAGIAIAVACTTALGPHVTQIKFIIRAVTQLQETQSILTLCMLLFVCIAAYPLGLSYRSRIFGVSMGLGIVSTTQLIGAAWLSQYKSMASTLNTISGLAICASIAVWLFYFAIPEPKRRT